MGNRFEKKTRLGEFERHFDEFTMLCAQSYAGLVPFHDTSGVLPVYPLPPMLPDERDAAEERRREQKESSM